MSVARTGETPTSNRFDLIRRDGEDSDGQTRDRSSQDPGDDGRRIEISLSDLVTKAQKKKHKKAEVKQRRFDVRQAKRDVVNPDETETTCDHTEAQSASETSRPTPAHENESRESAG